MSIEVHLPDGRVLQFPDGTSPEVVKAAARRMMGPAAAEIPNSGPAAAHAGLPADAREEKRSQIRFAQEHGDLGHAEVEDPGLFGVAKAGLKENVLDPAIGLAARANPVAIGGRIADRLFGDHAAMGPTDETVAALRESIHDEHGRVMQDYLAQDPNSLARQGLALGTDFATSAVPVLPGLSGAAGKVGAGAARLGARIAPEALSPGSAASQLLARAAGGAMEGGVLGLGKADPEASFGDQARTVAQMALLGGGMGALGGAKDVAGQFDRGELAPSGRPAPKPAAAPPPPTPDVRAQILSTYQAERAQAAQQAAQSIPTLIEQADTFLKAREQFPQLPASARPAGIPDAVLDELARVKAQERANPAIPTGYSGLNDQKLLQAVAEAAQKKVDAKWQPQFAFAGLSGDEALATLADKTQEAVAPQIQAPPPRFKPSERGSINLGSNGGGLQRLDFTKDRPLVNEAYFDPQGAPSPGFGTELDAARFGAWLKKNGIDTAEATAAGRMEGLGRTYFEMHHPKEPGGFEVTKNDTMGEAPDTRFQLNVGGRTINFGGKPRINPEAGFIKLKGGPKPPPPPVDPMDALVRPTEDAPNGTAMDRLRALGNRLYTEFIDKEAAPLQRLRKQGLKDVADHLETLQARARGAGGMAELPIMEGTYRFDKTLNGSVRTGDGLTAILGGADSQTLKDLDHFMAGQRHVELKARQEQAQLSYDWQRAQRLEELRSRRIADKASLANMAGDIRSTQAKALRTARNEAKARGEYRAFLLSEDRVRRASPLAKHRTPAELSTDLAAGRMSAGANPAQQARTEALRAIRGGQGVALGIRDQAAKARLPPIERPPGIDLKIDPAATAVVESKLAELGQRYGQDHATGRVNVLDDLADKIRDWSVRAVIDPLVEVGRLSADDKALILNAGEKYAPLFRLVERLGEDPEIAIGSTKASPIKEITGGLSVEAPAQPPLDSFVQQAQRVTMWAERQRVRNAFADAVDSSPGLQKEVRNVTSPAPGQANRPRGDTFVAWRNGSRAEYAAPADLISAFERLEPRQVNPVLEIAQVATRALRAGATSTLGFAARNPIRDQQTGAAYGAQYGYRPFVDAFHGLAEMMPSKSKAVGSLYKDWKAQGGAMSTIVDANRPRLERVLADASGQGGVAGKIARQWKAEGWAGKVAFPVLAPLEAFSQLTEKATRVGAFRRAKLAGASPAEAARFSRDVTLDFGRSGRLGQKWNGIEAFANAELQDVDRFARSLKARPVATTVKALAFLSIPAAANYYHWKDDPDYATLPEWEKISFYHVAKKDDGTFVRIPRPLGLLNLTYSYGVEKFLQQLDGQHPDAGEEFRNALFSQTPAHFASLDLIPTALQPAIEAAMNYSQFKDAPIVPAGLQGQLPEDQALDSTSGAARAIGGAAGIAPLKIDYLIRGYGASWGQAAAQMVPGGADMPPLPMQAKDIPGLGAFISPSSLGFGSDPVTKLYALSTEAAQAARSMKVALEGGDAKRYQAIIREHPEALLSETLIDARRQLSELRDQRNTIRRADGMTPEQRLDTLLQIDQAATQLSAAYMHGAADYLRGQRP